MLFFSQQYITNVDLIWNQPDVEYTYTLESETPLLNRTVINMTDINILLDNSIFHMILYWT